MCLSEGRRVCGKSRMEGGPEMLGVIVGALSINGEET